MLRKRERNADGVSAVEFGLVLPLLMMILLGIVDYGQLFFVRLNMINAAREGARIGATRSAANAADAALTATSNYLSATGVTAYLAGAGRSASVTASTPSDGDPKVVVQVTVPFPPLVGFVLDDTTMQVSATMRWELARPEP